jgi:hypothetical protein
VSEQGVASFNVLGPFPRYNKSPYKLRVLSFNELVTVLTPEHQNTGFLSPQAAPDIRTSLDRLAFTSVFAAS